MVVWLLLATLSLLLFSFMLFVTASNDMRSTYNEEQRERKATTKQQLAAVKYDGHNGDIQINIAQILCVRARTK